MTRRNKMNWGEVATAAVIVSAGYYFMWHIARFLLAIHMDRFGPVG